MAKYTVLGHIDQYPHEASPTLLFQKWHAYDRFESERDRKGRSRRLPPFETKGSRKAFLESVASAVQKWNQTNYAAWHDTYASACAALGAEGACRHSTSWRMVVGWSTNPALEVGVTLHHLHGFPYIPGSSVKGLLHHFAEMEWMAETMANLPSPGDPGEEPPESLKRAVEEASVVWALFGSLVVERATLQNGRGLGPQGPRERLAAWREKIEKKKLHEREAWKGVHADLVRLLDTHTGGALTCFDAVPAKEAMRSGILEPDILNPHYPKYYNSDGRLPPSDTGNPTPIYFLAVKPGKAFEFRFRLAGLPSEASPGEEGDARAGALGGRSRRELLDLVEEWLDRALSEWGVGGKTSAGYGYFDPRPTGQRGGGTSGTRGGDRPQTKSPKTNPPAAPAEIAKSLLPPRLSPSEVAGRIDRAHDLPEAVQREIARLLLERYPQQVKKWEKKKKKPSVQKRLAWVERFSGSGEGGKDA